MSYIYAKVKGSVIPQPLEAIPQRLVMKKEIDVMITVGDRLFYTRVRILQDATSITTVLGESFSFIMPKDDGAVKIKYKNSDNIRTLAVDLDFLISYIEVGSFKWNGYEIPFDYDGADFSDFNLVEEKARLESCKKIVPLLDCLGCKKDLCIKTLADKDWKHLNYLVTALVDKKPVEHLKAGLPVITSIDVGELKFVVCLQKLEDRDDAYNISDFFKTEMLVVYEKANGEKRSIYQYAVLRADDLIRADNIRYEVLLPSFKSAERHDETMTMANFFLLELLKAYDKDNSRIEILSTARAFSEWIFGSDDETLPYEIKLLNKLQIEKRVRLLATDEVKELIRIIETANASEEIRVGAYFLLDQQAAAELYFEKLETLVQEEFKKYPIFRFWKENGGNT